MIYDFSQEGLQQDFCPSHYGVVSSSIIYKFQSDAERQSGLVFNGPPLADGNIHRTPTEGKPSGKNGWYALHDMDGVLVGVFGNWEHDDGYTVWCSKSEYEMTPQEIAAHKAKNDAMNREFQAERARKYAEARIRAQDAISQAAQATEHPYLEAKKVKACSGLYERQGWLLCPVYDGDGRIQSYQAISGTGCKLFLPASEVKNGRFTIPGDTETTVVCEGLSTGLSLSEATGYMVVCAFNAGNLLPVAKSVRARNPYAKIVIAGDDDIRTDGKKNRGREAAEKTAREIDGIAAFPFLDGMKADWNDLHVQRGLDEVQRQFEGIINAFRLVSYAGDELLLEAPPELKYLIDGFLPVGIVGTIAAPGGTGKSYLLLILGICLSAGIPFMGREVQQCSVLCLDAEDDRDEKHRRIHAVVREYGKVIGQDIKPEQCGNYHSVDLVGELFQVIHTKDRQITQNDKAIQQIVEKAKSIDNLGLIVLDPLSRFREGDENDANAATKLVQALEVIRKATGVTVLVSHHSRKDSKGDHEDEIRGSSALISGMRWGATLAAIPEDRLGGFAGNEDWLRSLVRLRSVKSNYCPKGIDVWMERGAGGALVLTNAPVSKTDAKNAAKADKEIQKVTSNMLRIVKVAQESGKPLSRSKLTRGDYKKEIGVGRNKAESYLDQLLKSDMIVIDDNGLLLIPGD